MVQRRKVSKKPKAPRVLKTAPLNSISPVELEMKLTAGWPWSVLIGLGLAVAAFVSYLALDNDRPWHHGPVLETAKPVLLENWGPELTLDTVGKIKIDEEAWDLAADKQGDIYVLTESTIYCYHNGKKARSLFIGSTSARSMAFDGETFYITEVINSGIDKIKKDFLNPAGFGAAGTYQLLGIDYSEKKKLLITEDTAGKNLIAYDTTGQIKNHVAGPRTISGSDGYVMDLLVDEADNIIILDREAKQFSFYSPDYVLQKNVITPWNNPSRERMALLDGNIYINCLSDQCILVMDTQGKPVGRIKFASPAMIGAGKDGYLYVESDKTIFKLKPLPAKISAIKKEDLKAGKP